MLQSWCIVVGDVLEHPEPRDNAAVILECPEPQGDERPRKALRSDIPEVALADLKNASGDSAVLVIAVVTKVSVEALDSRVSFASNSMKFAVGLSTSCDSADEVLVDWWSNDGAFKQMVGNWQWLDMWEKCEGEDGRKAEAGEVVAQGT